MVTRRKRNAYCREVASEVAAGDAIEADRRVKIGHRWPHAAAVNNPLFDVVRREITVARPDKDEPLYLLTNDLDRPAAEIAQLYKARCDMELLFKWLKQNLKIRRFIGRSENVGRSQIDVALIAVVLLRILHQIAARSFKPATALLLARLKTSLFGPLNLSQTEKPPPRPPSLRPPHPRYGLAFQ